MKTANKSFYKLFRVENNAYSNIKSFKKNYYTKESSKKEVMMAKKIDDEDMDDMDEELDEDEESDDLDEEDDMY